MESLPIWRYVHYFSNVKCVFNSFRSHLPLPWIVMCECCVCSSHCCLTAVAWQWAVVCWELLMACTHSPLWQQRWEPKAFNYNLSRQHKLWKLRNVGLKHLCAQYRSHLLFHSCDFSLYCSKKIQCQATVNQLKFVTSK